MTFLNSILLGGLFAATIPILIHLFNKSRYRVVKWGAMHLLDAAFKVNKRRMQIENLLLLLVRCLVVAALALCMALPVFTGMKRLWSDAKSSLVILIDNSYSMEAGGAGNSNFSQAREAAGKIIETAARGSDISVVLMAGGVSPLLDAPTFDPTRLQKELAKLDAGYGTATVPEAMEYGAGLLAKMSHPYRQMVVISDFQRVSWSDKESAARKRAAELLKGMPLPPDLVLMHVGSEGHDNVAVESLDFSKLVFGIGQPMQLRATLHNFGEREYPELRVYFRVDGKERSASQVQLDPGEQKQVLFTTAFERPGSHVVEVYADADPLVADNSYQASIPVWDKVPVLLINGNPSSEPLKGETDFLEIALQPFDKSKKSDLTDLITTRTIDPRDLDPQAIANMRVIVLANVTKLTDPQLRALKEFVREGGGLLMFPGNKINADWYNNFMTGENGLLPMGLSSLAGALDDAAPHTRIVAEHYNHPALEAFNDPRNGVLSDAEIKLWYKTRAPAGAADPSITVLAHLDTGDPFLIEKKFGEGRVIQCSTPCNAEWNNLPVQRCFLPLMQRLVVYLASTVFPPRNVEVGQPLAAFFPRAEAGKKALITDPAGNKTEVDIIMRGTRGYAEYSKTPRPGLYLMTAPDGALTHFVVNTSRAESDLRQLSESEREAVAKEMGAIPIGSAKDFQKLDQSQRFGREVWRPLLWTTLALIFGELFLQQWFGRKN